MAAGLKQTPESLSYGQGLNHLPQSKGLTFKANWKTFLKGGQW